MKEFLKSIWSLISNHALTITIIVVLIIVAPQVFGPIIGTMLAVVGLCILLIMLLWVAIYLHVRKLHRQMEKRFGKAQDKTDGYGRSSNNTTYRDGDVTVTQTSAPEKRVSDDVGEYVDFKEVKESDKNE